MNADAVTDLFAALGRSTPSLPRATCRAHRDVFDSPEAADIERAVDICRRCPELEPCQRWAQAQPPRTLTGVVAGVDRTYTLRTANKKEI